MIVLGEVVISKSKKFQDQAIAYIESIFMEAL